jgi:hypothetical protein
MKSTFTPALIKNVVAELAEANARFARQFPGDSPARQPVQTVYGGAQIFKADTAAKLGVVALRALQENAPDAAHFAAALGWKAAGAGKLHGLIYQRVVEKLKREPVEDFRIDFEDGYGNRPDAEEDGHAEFTACEVARGLREGRCPRSSASAPSPSPRSSSTGPSAPWTFSSPRWWAKPAAGCRRTS